MTVAALARIRQPRFAVALFLVPMATLAAPTAALALDAIRGLVVEKCFVSEEMPLVAVIRTEDGAYRLLTSAELERNGLVYEVTADGTMAIALADGTERTELAVNDRPLPLDVLTAALVLLAGKQLVLAAPVPAETIDFRPSGGCALDEVAELWQAMGLSFEEHDGVVYVGTIAAPPAATVDEATVAPAPGTTPTTVTATALRSSITELAEVLEDSLGSRLSVGAGSQVVTVCVSAMPAERLLGHLRRLCSVAIEQAAAPVVNLRLTAAQGRPVFKRIVAMARQGDVAQARRTLVKLIRRSEPQARYYVALFQLSWKLGDRGRAVKAIKLALELDRSNEYARRVVKKLRALRAATAA